MDMGWLEKDYCKKVEAGSKLSSPKCFRLQGGKKKEGITDEGTVRMTKGEEKTAFCKQTSFVGIQALFGDNKREEQKKMSQMAAVLLISSLVLFCRGSAEAF